LLVVFVMACGSGADPETRTLPSPARSGSGSAAPAAPTSTLAPDDAALEAVYRHELAAAAIKPTETPCLRVRTAGGATADASPALIDAIHAQYPSAVAASTCSGGGPSPVTTASGGAAVMFDIGPVVRDAAGIRVEGGGGHRGGGSILELEYTLEAVGGGYRVVSERVLRQN
jgi:hypothetical protein